MSRPRDRLLDPLAGTDNSRLVRGPGQRVGLARVRLTRSGCTQASSPPRPSRPPINCATVPGSRARSDARAAPGLRTGRPRSPSGRLAHCTGQSQTFIDGTERLAFIALLTFIAINGLAVNGRFRDCWCAAPHARGRYSSGRRPQLQVWLAAHAAESRDSRNRARSHRPATPGEVRVLAQSRSAGW